MAVTDVPVVVRDDLAPSQRLNVYRRSSRSVTMRCEDCGLQWTMTWVKIHQAMERQLAEGKPP
jgi:hypothetical protein